MKKISLLFIILLCSCSPKENALESIEIMTYYYVPNKEQSKLITDCIDYSKIDGSGNAEAIRQIKPDESKYIYLKTEIDSKIVSDIAEATKSKNNSFYEKQIDTTSLDFYCGPTIRVKAKFEDGKVLTFTYREHEKDSRFFSFIKIQNSISSNYKKKRYEIIDSVNIRKEQKAFEKFSFSRDTLSLPMPPLSIDASEQVKFPPPNK